MDIIVKETREVEIVNVNKIQIINDNESPLELLIYLLYFLYPEYFLLRFSLKYLRSSP